MSRDIQDFVQGFGVGASIGIGMRRANAAERAADAKNPRNPEAEDFAARNDISGVDTGGVKGWLRRRKQDVFGGGPRKVGPSEPGSGSMAVPGVAAPAVDWGTGDTSFYQDGGPVRGELRDTEEEANEDTARLQASGQSLRGYQTEELQGASGDMPVYRATPKARALQMPDKYKAMDQGRGPYSFEARYEDGGPVRAVPYLPSSPPDEYYSSDEVDDARDFRGDAPPLSSTERYGVMGTDSGYVDTPSQRGSTVMRAKGPDPRGAGIVHPVARQRPGSPLGDEAILHGYVTDPQYSTAEQPGADPTSVAAVPVAGKGGTGGGGSAGGGGGSASGSVTPKGNAPRKKLGDQTRTEAFDPEADKDDPRNVLKNAIHGGLVFAQHIMHLDDNGVAVPNVPNPAREQGQKALMSGAGAATPEEMKQLEGLVRRQYPKDDFDGPDGEARKKLRYMEIVYRHASNNGLTDKANKMAFEIIQYAAGEAAKLGQQGVMAYKNGDIPTAIKATIAGFNAIPDGRSYTLGPDGKTVIVKDVVSGKVEEAVPYTPEMLFNAAMGLATRAGYWGVLTNRAAMATGGRRGTERTPLQDELTRSQIERNRAQADRARRGPVGRSGGTPQTSPGGEAVANILDNIGRMALPRRGASNKPADNSGGEGENTGGSNDEEARLAEQQEDAIINAGGEGGEGDDGSPTNTAVPANAGGEGGGEGPAAAPNAPPASVLRTAPGKPNQRTTPTATPAEPAQVSPPSQSGPFDPEGDGYDYETAKAAGLGPDKDGHWPSRDPRTGMLLKGRQHPTFEKGLQEDAKLGYVGERKDGRYYTRKPTPYDIPDEVIGGRAKNARPEVDFKDEHPLTPYGGKNPYTELLAGRDPTADPNESPAERKKREEALRTYFTTKEGKALKSGLIAKERELNSDVSAWKKDKGEADKKAKERFDTSEKNRLAGIEKKRNIQLTPEVTEKLSSSINTELQTRIDFAKDPQGTREEIAAAKRPSIFNDGTDPNTVHDIALDLLTTNPNIPAKRMVDVVAKMARAGLGEEDKDERSFKPKGRDDLKNIVVDLDGKLYHVRPQTYDAINKLVETRWQRNIGKGKPTGAVPGVPTQQGKTTTFDDVKKDAVGLGDATASWLAHERGFDKGVGGSVARGSMKALDLLVDPKRHLGGVREATEKGVKSFFKPREPDKYTPEPN